MTKAVVFLDPKGTIFEVIRAAKREGFRVIALSSDRSMIDSAPDPYASAVSLIDEVVPVEGWLDEGRVISICDDLHARNPIAGIYSGLDPCAPVLARLRAKFGLPTHSPNDIAVVLNKFQLRKKLFALGLSKIKNYHSDEVEAWSDWKFKKAAYFKPLHGFFSAYVQRCDNFEDLRKAQQAWSKGETDEPRYVRNYLRSSDGYHLEEAFDGELLSVEAIAIGGKLHVLGLLSRILYSKDPIVEMGSCFPYPHPASEKIIALVSEAHRALGLTDGPTHTEVIVGTNGDVEIIDLNPRFVGADVLQSINYALESRIEDVLLDYALGRLHHVDVSSKHFSCLQYFLPPNVQMLEEVTFPLVPEVKFKTTFMKSGAQISGTKRQIDYLGCYLTVMPTFDSARARSSELRSRVLINKQHQGEY